jgi:hypothetical protein
MVIAIEIGIGAEAALSGPLVCRLECMSMSRTLKV